MSRMKQLLRKLHLSPPAAATDHRPPPPPPPAPPPPPPPDSPLSAAPSAPLPPPAESTGERCEGFGFLEEEYQVQLALALSASKRSGLEGPDSVQMIAATQMSLGSMRPVAGDGCGGDADRLSLRYWSYNIVDYHEKLIDGFYVVHGNTSSHNLQGQMPSLLDLQATSVSDNIDYEVVTVNRAVDQALRQLERRAISIALESRVANVGPIASGLVQKIVDLVVDSMGGPVSDTDDILRRWAMRSHELRTSLKTVVLPLGSVNVGLSCHRALLFKVLADRINLPCRLVKGSYYTGTEEGAVNFIKLDYNSQYILDLMGAPGVLIPAESLSDYFLTSGPKLLSSSTIKQATQNLCLALHKVGCQFERKSELLEGSSSFTNETSEIVDLQPEEKSRVMPPTRDFSVDTTQRFEHEFGELPSLGDQKLALFENKEAASPSQQMKLDDVSKYVADAAKNPDFAQKLHAILLKSCVSRPPDFFSELNPSPGSVEQEDFETSISVERNVQEGGLPPSKLPLNLQSFFTAVESSCYGGSSSKEKVVVETAQKQDAKFIAYGNHADAGNTLPIETSGLVSHVTGFKDVSMAYCETKGTNAAFHISVAFHETDPSQKQNCSAPKAFCAQYNGLHMQSAGSNERINPFLNGVAEWEIPWENLQVGERIGIGSYGEVYRADMNGTEVAVKKFLDQDLSGDALEQIRSEIKIMLRLRHPNVILFMGAITFPPNLSILTEFLPRGSLYRLLHRPNVHIDEKRRLKMAVDVAKGMNYLHTSHPTIVHRDLKSPNLLVDRNWTVKVCDFGLSQLKHHTFLSSKSAAGTPEWMAPEVLRNEPSSEKCDVYSFGVILWELATLQKPWSGMNPMQVVGAVGFQNRHLDIPKEVDPMMAGVISDCWQNDPNERPSFAQLIPRLKQWKRLVVADVE